MNGLDNLLEKYFNGASSPEEEKELKNYFGGTGVLPEHEIYRPLFAVFREEKKIESPVMILPWKRMNRPVFTNRFLFPAVGSAAIILLAFTFSLLHRPRSQKPEYMVIVNGKQIVNRHKARQYADAMFWEAEKIVKNSYQPFREATDLKNDLNAEKIFRETEQKIEFIKTNHQQ